jgi:hypothetical protein
MHPYSHLVIAAELEKDIRPRQANEYYWGAVVPDIRYLADMQRDETHLSAESILEYLNKYPELDSFIKGYLIHCLTDLVDLHALLNQRILFRPILQSFPHQFMPVMLESYFIEHSKLDIQLSARPNNVLTDLKISDEHIGIFSTMINPFVTNPSFESALEFLRTLGHSNPRIERYINAARNFDSNIVLKSVLFALSNIPRLKQQVISEIRSTGAFKQIRLNP